MHVTASVLPGIAVATKTQVYVPTDRYGSLWESERKREKERENSEI